MCVWGGGGVCCQTFFFVLFSLFSRPRAGKQQQQLTVGLCLPSYLFETVMSEHRRSGRHIEPSEEDETNQMEGCSEGLDAFRFLVKQLVNSS